MGRDRSATRSSLRIKQQQIELSAIKSLIAACAELVDDGDFEGVGDLLATLHLRATRDR